MPRFKLGGPGNIIFTVDVSFTTRQVWLCIPRGCLSKLPDDDVLNVINLVSTIGARLAKIPYFKGWTIHA